MCAADGAAVVRRRRCVKRAMNIAGGRRHVAWRPSGACAHARDGSEASGLELLTSGSSRLGPASLAAATRAPRPRPRGGEG